MKCIDLTDTEKELSTKEFDHLSRVDNVFVASRVSENIDTSFFKDNDIKVAIDLKQKDENPFDDADIFSAAKVDYHRIPISSMDDVTHEVLMEIKKLIDNADGNVLFYCASGNRVSAVLALMLYNICGHPRARVLDFAKKIAPEKFPLYEKLEGLL